MIIPFFQSCNADFTLYSGDCMDVVEHLPDNSVDVVFADPPYFLSNGGISVKNGQKVCVDKGDWDKGGSPEHVDSFNHKWLSIIRSKLNAQGTIWISGTHHNIFSIERNLCELGYKILNIITWQKTDPPPNLSCRYFNFSTEVIIWARKCESRSHKFNYMAMKQLNGGRQMTDVWRLPAVGMWEKTCGKHPTQKPLRLLYRIILASTNKGDCVLDPFSGSGTTGIAANLLGRSFIGIEQEIDFLELSRRRRKEIDSKEVAQRLLNKMVETLEEKTVLVNHVRATTFRQMIENGICYLRAGDSRGSLLVRSGFERLGYILLHTNGENQQLFRLSKYGFQIWTPESLRKLGFPAEHAPYYAVLHFDPKPITFNRNLSLAQGRYTNVAKIMPLSLFLRPE